MQVFQWQAARVVEQVAIMPCAEPLRKTLVLVICIMQQSMCTGPYEARKLFAPDGLYCIVLPYVVFQSNCYSRCTLYDLKSSSTLCVTRFDVPGQQAARVWVACGIKSQCPVHAATHGH